MFVFVFVCLFFQTRLSPFLCDLNELDKRLVMIPTLSPLVVVMTTYRGYQWRQSSHNETRGFHCHNNRELFSFSIFLLHSSQRCMAWCNFSTLPSGLHSPYISRVSCQKVPTRHADAWQIGPFWQDTLDISTDMSAQYYKLKFDISCVHIGSIE